jgi:hypothetical protein
LLIVSCHGENEVIGRKSSTNTDTYTDMPSIGVY